MPYRSITNFTAAILFLLTASLLPGADLSTYRGFRFGSSLTAAAAQAGANPSDVRLVYERPALIQEVNWLLRPTSVVGKPDPVREGLLSFLNGQLYRIEVTYDRYQVEGMTPDDMILAISETYGAATRPNVEIPYHSNYAETAAVLARWEDSKFSYDLVRTGDKASFVLVLYSKVLNPLAQAAIKEAVRLEVLMAPQRAKAAEQKRAEDDRLAMEKARVENKTNFRP
ncbi:MAG: hypothetical protein WDO18_13750 [Acidobacteriota bacterium]